MRFWWAAVLVSVVAVILAVVVKSTEYRCIFVNALGYDGHSGTIIPLEFCMVPGDGSLYLDSQNIYGMDFQMAVATARDVFMQRYSSHGKSVFLRVHGAPEYFDGRSVALAIYAGIFAVNFGYDISTYAITGDLSSDGSVLPVAYVDEKAFAFDGPLVVPKTNCRGGFLCISRVSQLEDILSSKRV